MSAKIQGIRGMEDVLPEASALWEKLEDACREVFRAYGYRNLRTPIVEPTALFVRGIGDATDIVEKEMYVFEDRNGESLALRPEATAGIVRSAIEHNFLYNGPMRVWTTGPMFRYERPQKGRYRQFHQFDVEALGFDGPDVDAEQMAMLTRLWKALGLRDVELQVNSIGDAADRRAHRGKLMEYLERNAALLDEDSKRRLQTNPLRILDSKNPAMRGLIEGAPRLIDFLGEGAAEHFEALKVLLEQAGVPYKVNPHLVRGLDYYNLTVFEWVTDRLGSQSAV
jgi:histidyl-tRNA synthetase